VDKGNLSKLTDEKLIEKATNDGDIDAFGIIYDRYHQRVFNKCIIFVKSKSLAEDLTHDIFLKAFTKLSQFDFKSKFSTWFYSLAYHQCIDQVRKMSYDKKTDYIEMEAIEERRVKVTHTDSESKLLGVDVETLEKVLDKLLPNDKMILLMKYQDDMSIKELQQEFEIGESAVKMRLLRARERAVAIYETYFKT
jgi:RNA polymerase sigma-70 factor (ECF subfamily)